MREPNPTCARRSGATICGFLFCLSAFPAAADYDSSSLNSNLQDQCKEFAATVSPGVSFIVSADCNKEGNTSGTVAASLNSARFDLSGHVRWETDTQVLTWDTAAAGSNQDIADKCRPKSASPFTVSASNVTLALSCPTDVTGGTPNLVSLNLPLNGYLKVGSDGSLSRR